MDGTNSFGASDRSIYPVVRNSDCSIEVRRRWLKQENIREMRPDFDYIDAGGGDIAEWTSPVDSVYQIGPYTLSKHVLTVDERVVDRDFKVAET